MSALQRVLDICGTQAEFARRLQAILQRDPPIQAQHIWNWVNRDGGRVPGEFCRAAEQAVDGEVTRYELRPDIFGPPPPPAAPTSSQEAAA